MSFMMKDNGVKLRRLNFRTDKDFSELPPVGEAVCLDQLWSDSAQGPLTWFSGYRALWLNSGTAALALALIHAREVAADDERREVILPAYGCPDLVAATVYAGLQPVLVDIGSNDPAYDLAALGSALCERSLAVVAVNFLGIAERLEEIRALLPEGCALVEDNAQWHPPPDARLHGDYVVRSFGRGKPASVLGGGLLLLRNGLGPTDAVLKNHVRSSGAGSLAALGHFARARAYNMLRRPAFYYWLHRCSFLPLGETRYKPLESIETMPSHLRKLLARNVQLQLSSPRWRERYYDEMLAGIDNIHPLKRKLESRCQRLLRYPVLCDSAEQREALLASLNEKGLGVSPLYGRALCEVEGVAERIRLHGDDSKARHFAERLITLPLHSGVSDEHLARLAATLRRSKPSDVPIEADPETRNLRTPNTASTPRTSRSPDEAQRNPG